MNMDHNQQNNYQQPGQAHQQPDYGYQQTNYQYYNPQQRPGTSGYVKGPIGEIRSPVTVLLLSLVTCGIYGIIWFYKVSQEINDYTRSELTSPTFAIVGIFCFVFTYINAYKIDEALYLIDSTEGRRPEKRFLLWILLSFLAGIGALMMIYQVQESLNRIWQANLPPGYNPY